MHKEAKLAEDASNIGGFFVTSAKEKEPPMSTDRMTDRRRLTVSPGSTVLCWLFGGFPKKLDHHVRRFVLASLCGEDFLSNDRRTVRLEKNQLQIYVKPDSFFAVKVRNNFFNHPISRFSDRSLHVDTKYKLNRQMFLISD